MPKKRFYLWSIGCQMNQSDARRLSESLQRRGYEMTRDPRQADVLVLNTCVVRQSAEDRVIGRLQSLRPLVEGNSARCLLVMGCWVGDIPSLRERYPFVHSFYRPSDVKGVLDAIDAWDGETEGIVRESEAAQVSEFVPISYGCDHHCTYCIVTLRRGPQQSRPMDDILADVRDLVGRGAREITLLGQNVDAYGHDLPERPDLADLLRAVHDIPNLWRIRFLTSHPRDMSERIIQAVAELPRVCPSWELPVQSGDDAILRRMARGYTVAQFLGLVERIRRATPDCSINTDIIVGFCGETEAQFERTLHLVEHVRFDVVHVAAYSVRPGTPAARWPDDVPPEEKERRRKLIEETQERIATEINANLLSQTVEILVDGRQKGRWRGRTRTNKLVFFDSEEDWLGKLAHVRVTWAGPWSLIGEPVRDASPASR